MSMQNEVVRVLGERATHRINFNYGRIRVDPAAFTYVQRLFREGQVSIDTDPSLTWGARYERNTHTLHFWRGADPSGIRRSAESKALVVHECVHVLTHFRCGSHVAMLDDEIAAYLAQTIYRLGIQGFVTRGSSERGGSFSTEVDQHASTPSGQIFDAARQIVTAHHMLDQEQCVPLFADDVAELREAIRSHPVYS